MTDEVLIKCDGVRKRFCRNFKQSLWYGVTNIFADYACRAPNAVPELRPNEFWANNDISFEVQRGECLGLIGHNGSGKTTLLKILTGILKPDSGRVEMRGRIGSLIALGAGFDPVLTGRENIFINGAILGLTKREIRDKLDEIVAFSELDKSIDAPVRNYSSGMQVRLGFAVAAILTQPDVLLLDEILAVGDISFTIKCLNRVRQLLVQSAVVLVTHNLQYVGNYCTQALLLNNGEVSTYSADVPSVLNNYMTLHSSDLERKQSGTGDAVLHSFSLNRNAIQQCASSISAADSTLTARLDLEVLATACDLTLIVKTIADESLMHLPCLTGDGIPLNLCAGRHRLNVLMPLGDLNAGTYKLHLTLANQNREVALRVDNLCTFQVHSDQYHWGKLLRPVHASLETVPS